MLKLAVLGCLLVIAHARTLEDGDRIVGGSAIEITEAPYQLAMQRDTWGIGIWSFSCGAVIISTTKGLTAAHCTINSLAARVRLRAGSTTQASGGVLITLTSIINHPNYSAVTVSNDIAVLEFEQTLAFTDSIQAIALANAGHYPPSGAGAYVSGWGSIVVGGGAQTSLHAATVPIVALDTCNDLYASHSLNILPDMLCAGVVGVGGIDACSGDSGGPLVVNNLLVGLVSWGDSCALAHRPGVYAGIGHFRSWISQNAGV